MVKPCVSEFTTRRLSLYLRSLTQLEEMGVETISSRTLAEDLTLTPYQVRRDLACFGEFGVRGVGYDVKALRLQIERILGLERTLKVVILGAGNLGNALADYHGFNGDEFEVCALFDVDPEKVGGTTRRGTLIYHLDELARVARAEGVEVGIVAVPAEVAQRVVDRLVEADIRAVLNFAPVRPQVPDGIRCKSVDLKVELESLSFFLAARGLTEETAAVGSTASAR
ncbi:MAG: redox-sensing transcriptional repressor Rex [Acidobacteriota bacterium]